MLWVQNSSADPTPDPETSSEVRRDSSPLIEAGDGLPEAWGPVPLRNKNFTGRGHLLRQLRDNLTAGGLAAVVPQAMHGLGGVGKTQIAIEYAYRYQQFYDVVWWVPADEDSLIASSVAALAPYLALPSAGAGLEAGAGHEVAAKAVLEALRLGKPFKRWLLVFDAADGPSSIRRFLLNGTGHTLITSRNPNWEEVAETLYVDVFSREESSEYLSRRVPGIDPQDSNNLADALGDLPLALDQAGGLQLAAGIPVPEYLVLLQERAGEALKLAAVGDHPRPVTATWAASVSYLNSTVPEAIELLRTCAFFGPQPIPRYVLRGHPDVVTDSLGRILREPVFFTKAIGSLNRYSLARADAHQGAIVVHRLVQAVTRDALPAKDRERFRHDVQLLLAAATPTDPDDSSTWARFAELLPHYGPAAMIAGEDRKIRESVGSVIRYQYMAGALTAALELADEALAEWSRDPHSAPEDLLAVKRHRGAVLRALGRYHDAYEANAAAVAEALKELGPEHAETLLITNSHGADIRAAGDFSAAYQLDEDSVRRHSVVFGETHPMTLRAKNNLALDQALIGDFRGARELHEQVYHLGREVYGRENHPTVLSSLNNLTRAVRLCGEYDDALFMAEDNYAACRTSLGSVHPITLSAARDLVISERLAVGGTEETVEHAMDVLNQHTKQHGDSHPDTLAAATAVVNTRRQAGQLDDAILLAEHIVKLAPEVYGPDHPYWYLFRGNLAILLRLSGATSRALELHETSVDRLDVLLGPDHPYTLTCAMGLASDLAAIEDLSAAQSQGRDTLERLRRVLGPEHPMTLACAINFASDLRANGEELEADQLRSNTLDRYMQTLKGQHPTVKAARDGQRIDFDFDPPPS